MRLDKFLKLSRIIKRRTVAKEVTASGRVLINGKDAKPGTDVAVGDELVIRFGQKTITVRVDLLTENPRKQEAENMYTVLKEEAHPSNLMD